MKKFCAFILKTLGWSLVSKINFPDKCVICVAPHTSNWDLPLGLLVYTAIGRKASFLIKKDWFFFPMNIFFNIIGGIPVDRSKKTSMTEQIAEVFNANKKFQLAVTPEGTRKGNSDWKKGFYYIAQEAKVPIVVASMDYAKKTITFHKEVHPSGDIDADMVIIKDCYAGVTAKHPENFKY